jgi:hypothetical protein
MSRKLLISLLAVAFIAAPGFTPAAITGLSDSATATTVKSSKSNSSDRMGGGPGKKAAPAKTAPFPPPSKGQSTY